ncbi:MAG: hypothetical protein PHX45_05505 [Acidobacteriota bacterium]|nr:hypothetical protein [Acidobacteriota bacterium]
MATEMNVDKSLFKPSIQGTARVAKRERMFELSLPALVSGYDAEGKKIDETSELETISAQEASFWLNAPLMIGSKVFLTLDIPRTLILEKPLKLLISGTVVYVKSGSSKEKRQLVAVRLDRSYKLQPLAPQSA